nr:hypothetical protein CFP56_64709 [Quercus suber]
MIKSLGVVRRITASTIELIECRQCSRTSYLKTLLSVVLERLCKALSIMYEMLSRQAIVVTTTNMRDYGMDSADDFITTVLVPVAIPILRSLGQAATDLQARCLEQEFRVPYLNFLASSRRLTKLETDRTAQTRVLSQRSICTGRQAAETLTFSHTVEANAKDSHHECSLKPTSHISATKSTLNFAWQAWVDRTVSYISQFP